VGRLVLNIRFVQHGEKHDYTIQRKTFFGWRSYRYEVGGCGGGSVLYEYTDTDKSALLDKNNRIHILDKERICQSN